MDFCSFLTVARVDVGNIVKKLKILKVLLLEVFFNRTLSIDDNNRHIKTL